MDGHTFTKINKAFQKYHKHGLFSVGTYRSGGKKVGEESRGSADMRLINSKVRGAYKLGAIVFNKKA